MGRASIGLRRSAPPRCHSPRKRGIQYVALPLDHRRLGVLDRPVKPGDDGGVCGDDRESRLYPAAPATFACFTGATSVVAIRRFSSGMQEPQLVPALSFTPISAAVRAPATMVSQMVPRPTPKQAQTTGPVEAAPSLDLPDNSMRRCSSVTWSATNRLFTTSQSPASCAGPTNRQVSMRSPANEAAR